MICPVRSEYAVRVAVVIGLERRNFICALANIAGRYRNEEADAALFLSMVRF